MELHVDALGCVLQLQVVELFVSLDQFVLVVEHGLDQFIDDILRQFIGSDQSSADGNGLYIGILTLPVLRHRRG